MLLIKLLAHISPHSSNTSGSASARRRQRNRQLSSPPPPSGAAPGNASAPVTSVLSCSPRLPPDRRGGRPAGPHRAGEAFSRGRGGGSRGRAAPAGRGARQGPRRRRRRLSQAPRPVAASPREPLPPRRRGAGPGAAAGPCGQVKAPRGGGRAAVAHRGLQGARQLPPRRGERRAPPGPGAPPQPRGRESPGGPGVAPGPGAARAGAGAGAVLRRASRRGVPAGATRGARGCEKSIPKRGRVGSRAGQ